MRDAIADQLSEALEDLVAKEVSARVVDALEVIDVDHERGGVGRQVVGLFHERLKGAPVGESRERILVGFVEELVVLRSEQTEGRALLMQHIAKVHQPLDDVVDFLDVGSFGHFREFVRLEEAPHFLAQFAERAKHPEGGERDRRRHRHGEEDGDGEGTEEAVVEARDLVDESQAVRRFQFGVDVTQVLGVLVHRGGLREKFGARRGERVELRPERAGQFAHVLTVRKKGGPSLVVRRPVRGRAKFPGGAVEHFEVSPVRSFPIEMLHDGQPQVDQKVRRGVRELGGDASRRQEILVEGVEVDVHLVSARFVLLTKRPGFLEALDQPLRQRLRFVVLLEDRFREESPVVHVGRAGALRIPRIDEVLQRLAQIVQIGGVALREHDVLEGLFLKFVRKRLNAFAHVEAHREVADHHEDERRHDRQEEPPDGDGLPARGRFAEAFHRDSQKLKKGKKRMMRS